MTDTYFVRAPHPEDLNFIKDGIVKTAFKLPGIHGHVVERLGWDVYHRQIDVVYARMVQRNSFLVACDPEAPIVAYGFLSYRKQGDVLLVDYTYVKSAWRRLGIASQLLTTCIKDSNPSGVVLTSLPQQSVTRGLVDHCAALCPNVSINPYLGEPL